jgi:aryl-alcohol dehydrogenase-like predicted oxidoreductase
MTTGYYHAGWGTGTIASLGRRIPREAISQFRQMFAANTQFAIDTADSYGSGDAERLLARILPRDDSSRMLITKAGYIYSNLPAFLGPTNQFLKKLKQRVISRKCFAPDYLEKCLRASLVRLNKSKVSAFLLHDPTANAVKDQAVWRKLRALRDSGLTAKIGVSTGRPDIVEAALATGEIEILQTPANLLKASELKAVWRKCHLAGVYIIGNHLFPSFLVNQRGIRHEDLAKASAALLPPGSTLLCGTHNPVHLKEFAHWIESPFCKAQLTECFTRAGIIPEEFNYD